MKVLKSLGEYIYIYISGNLLKKRGDTYEYAYEENF